MSDFPEAPSTPPSGASDRGTRLDSWKEIAAYAKRDVRTLQRWEKHAGFPVRRLQKPGLRAVYAYTADLDAWLRDQEPQAAEAAEDTATPVGLPAATALPAAPSVDEPRSRRRLWFRGAVAALAIIGIGTAVTLATRSREAAPLGPFTARPITSEAGNDRDPDVSPDGAYVAYAYQAPDLRTRIMVRPVDGGEPRPITPGTVDEWSPAWSPDGAKIAFLRGDPADSVTVIVASAYGGDERPVATVRPYARRRLLLVGHLLAWTPDGRHLVVPDRAGDEPGRLILLAVSTGERTTLTSAEQGQSDVEPSLSADGRLLLFNRMRGEYLSDAYVQRLDAAFRPSGAPWKLASAGSWNGTPRLLEDRSEVLTSSGSLPRLSLWRQPLDGRGTPVSLGVLSDNATQSAVDRRRGRIIARTFRSQSDILRLRLPETRGGVTALPVEDFLSSTYIDRAAVYSPDGARIAFISDRNGRRQLWVADADGTNLVEWTQTFEADLPMPAWSPDGTQIAFAGITPSGHSQLFIANGATRLARQLTHDDLDYVRPAWSPDGASLYAAATDRSAFSLYRVMAADGTTVRVAPDIINVIDVSPDGSGVYVVARDTRTSTTLEYLPLAAGPVVRLASMNFSDDAWVARDGVYFLERSADKPLAPVRFSFRTHQGRVTVLHEFARTPGRGLSISPDRRFALTTRFVPPIADLLLLEPAR